MNLIIKIEVENEGEWIIETKPLTFTIMRFIQENVKDENIPIEVIESIIDRLVVKVKSPEGKEYTSKEEIKDNVPFGVYAGLMQGLAMDLTQKKRSIKFGE